ncbi:hypothetical protein SAMN05518672_107167 [Chitinophaga sp. CF118]|uniref:hypothetical protein n=1 Tax=Chitinophaga sp. CF118 TaxID=1884367 RepID=UPI0008E895A7|nr:hypothetical protein [Chitinophaga sp. CF118]SFE54678.1 hypothetical protein SAMN05518672_107167 [Chitinophaga sp. CF118]
MNTYLYIPEPCHEDWNNMLPENKGRHCLQCCKTVIDFTSWEATDIAAYLKANASQKVCGRFKEEQLNEPVEETIHRIYYSNLSVFKKIAAIVVIVFGIAGASCNMDVQGKIAKHPMGEPAPLSTDTTGKQQLNTPTLPKNIDIVVGTVAVVQPPHRKKKKVE